MVVLAPLLKGCVAASYSYSKTKQVGHQHKRHSQQVQYTTHTMDLLAPWRPQETTAKSGHYSEHTHTHTHTHTETYLSPSPLSREATGWN